MRKRLRNLFADAPDFHCLAVYASAEAALAEDGPALSALDLLLVDLELPGMDGAALIARLRTLRPELRLVVLTVFEDEASIVRALQNGAAGYLLKDTPDDRLIAELRVIQLGGSAMTPRVAAKIMELATGGPARIEPAEHLQTLTDREQQVMNHIALGFKYGEIADELNISSHTVRRHIEKIYRKLEVHSRSQAIQRSKNLGYLHDRF